MNRLTTLVPGLRALTPVGWAIGIALCFGVVLMVLGGLGFRWDPFDLGGRRLDRAEQAASVATAEAGARSAEAVGQAAQVTRLDTALQTTRSLDRLTTRSTQDARTADDALLPLARDRADRLHDHDRQLCRIAPDLDGCAASSDSAGSGQPSV